MIATLNASSFTATGTGAVTRTLSAKLGDVVNLKDFGAVCDGITDDSAALVAALAALSAAGGGTLFLPIGITRINSQITIPRDNVSTPVYKQAPIRIVGAVPRQVGRLLSVSGGIGGSVLDLRYGGTVAKILTLGSGLLQFENVTLADLGTSSTPFILVTNTVLKMLDCTFAGNPSKILTTCDQDAIILGGGQQAYTEGNLATSSFAGYGCRFDGLLFSSIRRGFWFRSSVNSVVFNNCTWDQTCGGLTAVELDGTGDQCRGNNGTGNLIEMIGYTWGMTFRNAGLNVFFATSFWDTTTGVAIQIIGNSNGNEFLSTFGVTDVTATNVVANGNTFLLTNNGHFLSPVSIVGELVVTNTGKITVVTATDIQSLYLHRTTASVLNAPVVLIDTLSTLTGVFQRYGDIALRNVANAIGVYSSISNYNAGSAVNCGIDFINVDQVNEGAIRFITRNAAGYGERMRIDGHGWMGLGVVVPTAVLHIKAGTATASTAPIKLTAGVLLTTPELGAIEFVDNGTIGHLYVTLSVGGVVTRVQIV